MLRSVILFAYGIPKIGIVKTIMYKNLLKKATVGVRYIDEKLIR